MDCRRLEYADEDARVLETGDRKCAALLGVARREDDGVPDCDGLRAVVPRAPLAGPVPVADLGEGPVPVADLGEGLVPVAVLGVPEEVGRAGVAVDVVGRLLPGLCVDWFWEASFALVASAPLFRV